MTDKRLDELVAHFGGTQVVNEDATIRLVHPSHTCSQRMRVSKWKRYELMNVRAPIAPTPPSSLTSIVLTNGMRVSLRRPAKG